MRILIVEDEFSLADVLASRLKKENYEVDIAVDGEVGQDMALENIYDLIILDVMLPKLSGLEILREIKINDLDSKIIMLTAKGEIEDKLLGLNAGADDYITKPFHIEEVVARVNIQLRKNGNKNQNEYLQVGDLRLYLKKSKLECVKTNENIEISFKEFMLIEYLMKNQNIIISKDMIYEKIWGLDYEMESNNLEAYLSFLRKKIKLIGSKITIKAIRGLGYKLEVNDEEIKK